MGRLCNRCRNANRGTISPLLHQDFHAITFSIDCVAAEYNRSRTNVSTMLIHRDHDSAPIPAAGALGSTPGITRTWQRYPRSALDTAYHAHLLVALRKSQHFRGLPLHSALDVLPHQVAHIIRQFGPCRESGIRHRDLNLGLPGAQHGG